MAEKKSLGQAYIQIMPTTDGIKKRLEEALGGVSEEAGRSAGTGWSDSFGSVLKANLVTEGVKLALDGAKQLGQEVIGLAKDAVSSYADYEQLVGGVETLFTTSADQVQQYAATAYKTAGLSANQYMETATSFAAALIQSVDGNRAKAAELVDLAVTDMADNANKMGSSMESIQNAYQGFAKQNYSMLDNLKLGYGGTQTEMFRLLQDAAGLNDEFARTAEFSLNNKGHLEVGYADIVRAIHIVQDEMGITGTTALEAEHTISGSLASMRSAWENLVTGIADENANFDQLVQEFVGSALIAGENLIPRIEQALTGVGKLIDGLAPVIAEKLPGLAQIIIPPIIGAAGQIIAALASALPSLVGPVITAILQSVDAVGAAIGDKVPALAFIFDNLSGVIVGVTAAFVAYKAVLLAQQVAAIAAAIAQGELNIAMLANPAGLIVAAIAGLVAAFVVLWNNNEGFRQFWINLWETLKTTVKNAVDAIVGFFNGVVDFITNNWQGLLLTLVNPFAGAFKLIYDNCEEFRNFFDSFVARAKEWGSDMLQNFINGIVSKAKALWDTMKDIAQGIRDYLGFSEPEEGPLSNFSTYAPDMMELFARGIRDNEPLVRNQLQRSFDFSDTLSAPAYRPASRAMQAQAVAVESTQKQPRMLTVILELDHVQCARLVHQLNDEETQRIGVRLAKGAV